MPVLPLMWVSPKIASAKINDKTSESYIVLSSKPNLNEANFLAVIFPEAKPGVGNYGPRPVTTQIMEPGWTGARVEHSGDLLQQEQAV